MRESSYPEVEEFSVFKVSVVVLIIATAGMCVFGAMEEWRGAVVCYVLVAISMISLVLQLANYEAKEEAKLIDYRLGRHK